MHDDQFHLGEGAAAWPAGGGEMGERIRSLDWASTPLGPTAGWPQSLRSAVSILLPSKAQICPFWGPGLIKLHNDDVSCAFISRVRALDSAAIARTPAVALAAYGRVEDRLRILSAGHNMRVPNPVDPAELATAVANLAGRL